MHIMHVPSQGFFSSRTETLIRDSPRAKTSVRMLIQSSSHFGPVTGLCFVADCLYVGQGSKLKTYNWRTGEELNGLEVFPRNKIHGIESSRGRMVVWGERSIAFLTIGDGGKPSIVYTGQMNDWISAAQFRGDNVCVQTAHNRIVIVEFSSASVKDTVGCSENSILYSGTILADSPLVAAGTVLHGVVVWNMDTGAILQELTSHEGSIFGVEFSKDAKRLVSCSDDRSIRLWDLETGKELSIGWGHTSRIWDLRFVGDKHILSSSEDCTARLWSIEGDELVQVGIFEGHHGRNVWTGAVHESGVVATGGSDGRVLLWNTMDIKTSTAVTSVAASLPGEPKGVLFKNYAAVDGQLVVATSNGKLWCCDTAGFKSPWKQVPDMELDGHSIAKPVGSDVCICTRTGDLYVFDPKSHSVRSRTSVDVKGKVYDVIPFTTKSEWYAIVVTQNPNDDVLVYSMQQGSLVARLSLPPTFVPTSVVYSGSRGVLLLGSRFGAIATYAVDVTQESTEKSEYVGLWRRLMSDDTVTDSKVIKDSDECIVLCASRAGHYSTFRVESQHDITLLTSNRLTRGSIEKIVVSPDGRTAFVGFKNDYLYVWDLENEVEAMHERCGGPHRSWFIDVSGTPSHNHLQNIWNYTFYYTKVSDIHMVSSLPDQVKFHATVVQSGSHGREVRGVAFHPASQPDFRVLATGAEDTTVRFCSLADDGSLKTWSSHAKHVSGIQSLQWTSDGDYLLTSAAREELFFWKVMVDSGVDAHLAAVLPVVSDVPDLRIMAADTIRLAESKYLVVTAYSNSTIRIWFADLKGQDKFHLLGSATYTHCCLLNADFVVTENHAFILVSGTDGYLSAWTLDGMLEANGFKCDSGRLIGPDNVSSFQAVALGVYATRLQLHQSGVKDKAIRQLSSSQYMHVSCGDDNAIVACSVVINGAEVHLQKLGSAPTAHSTAITGIQPIGDDAFVSISTDQYVRVWRLDDSNTPRLVGEHYTTVADTGVVDAISTENGHLIAIGGSGLSFWHCTL